MALSIFIDALPFSEIENRYQNWFDGQQFAKVLPNIAYSSSLHWQLYCDKYPDERGVLVDWCMEKEKDRSVRVISKLFSFMDYTGDLGIIFKKILSKYVYRKNAFANIPFRFRADFSEKGEYLFWRSETYRRESVFDGYMVISQDENHISFDKTIQNLHSAIESGVTNIFLNTGFADSIGHVNQRGEQYSYALGLEMEKLRKEIAFYLEKHPDQEILIVSDHGMSTIHNMIDLKLESYFGKQSKDSYIAYSDSCIMCVWVYDDGLREPIENYLLSRTEGHLLSNEDREYYRATDKKFGDFLYVLKEGNCFLNNWFGKSFKKPSVNGQGMHGFWPEWSAYDQLASVILINSERHLADKYTYPEVHLLIKEVMH